MQNFKNKLREAKKKYINSERNNGSAVQIGELGVHVLSDIPSRRCSLPHLLSKYSSNPVQKAKQDSTAC